MGSLTMPLTVEPDHVWLNTGTNLGQVPVVINLLDNAPASEEGWERVSEAQLEITDGSLMVLGGLSSWHGDLEIPPGSYHVRYYGRNVLQAADDDPLPPDQSPVDSYQLDIWPA
jgi:hypothetical protein